jgi:hypothetical protein
LQSAKKPVREQLICAAYLLALYLHPSQDFLVKTLLEGIPPLSERVKLLREREIARRGGAVETDAKSQSECAPDAATHWRAVSSLTYIPLFPPGMCAASATGTLTSRT